MKWANVLFMFTFLFNHQEVPFQYLISPGSISHSRFSPNMPFYFPLAVKELQKVLEFLIWTYQSSKMPYFPLLSAQDWRPFSADETFVMKNQMSRPSRAQQKDHLTETETNDTAISCLRNCEVLSQERFPIFPDYFVRSHRMLCWTAVFNDFKNFCRSKHITPSILSFHHPKGTITAIVFVTRKH